MSKKGPANRYRIAQCEGIETRRIKNIRDIEELKEHINKYNNKSSNPFLLGDINYDLRTGIFTFRRFRKISEATTLDTIDKSTVNFKSSFELKRIYNSDMKNNHPFVIIYRAAKTLKILPIVYEKNKKYLDKRYVLEEFIELGRDISFVNKLINSQAIRTSSRTSIEDYDNLYILRDVLKHELPSTVNLSPMHKFFKSFTYEGGKFNYFNFRLLAMLVKEQHELYEEEMEKHIEETEEEKKQESEEPILGQMILPEYANMILKDAYEELKLGVIEGSLEEVYGKKLIPRHKTTK